MKKRLTAIATAAVMSMAAMPVSGDVHYYYGNYPAMPFSSDYTITEFMRLDKETVIAEWQELSPDKDVNTLWETAFTEIEASLGRGELLISAYLPYEEYFAWAEGYILEASEIFDTSDAQPFYGETTYKHKEIDGTVYVEVEFSYNGKYDTYTAENLCNAWVWIGSQQDVRDVTIEDTAYTPGDLTIDEIRIKYDFDTIMKSTAEEICSFSGEYKELYERVLYRCNHFGTNNYMSISFTDEYTDALKLISDPLYSRETFRKDFGLDDELVWALVPWISATGEVPVVNDTTLRLQRGSLRAYSEKYSLEENEFMARLVVYLSLNPAVESIYGYETNYAPTGYFWLTILSAYGFEFALECDYTRLADNMPCCYLDGLEAVKGFSDGNYSRTLLVEVMKPNSGAPIETEKLMEDLYITAEWLGGNDLTLAEERENSLLYRLDIDNAFINWYVARGYDIEHIMAMLYAWFDVNDRAVLSASFAADGKIYKPQPFMSIPDGYIVHDDDGEFGSYIEKITPYMAYAKTDSSSDFMVIYDYTFHNLRLGIKDAEAFEAIYAEYFDKLNCTGVTHNSPDSSGKIYYELFDIFYHDNELPDESKLETAKEFVAALRAADAIESAEYRAYKAESLTGRYGGYIWANGIPKTEENVERLKGAAYKCEIGEPMDDSLLPVSGDSDRFAIAFSDYEKASLAMSTMRNYFSSSDYDAYFERGMEFDAEPVTIGTEVIVLMGEENTQPTEEPTDTLDSESNCGDVNLDGKVSVVDVVNINKYNAKIIDFTDAQKQNANCCYDGVIDSRDGTALMMFLVDKVQALPIVIE